MERSRPRCEGCHEHFWCRRLVSERRVGPDRVVVASPAFDDDLGLAQSVEDLSIEQLIAKACIEALDTIALVTGAVVMAIEIVLDELLALLIHFLWSESAEVRTRLALTTARVGPRRCRRTHLVLANRLKIHDNFVPHI